MRWERPLAVLTAALGVVLLGVGGAILSIQGRLTTSSGYPLIAGLALLIAYALLDPRALTDLVRSRRSRFGTLSVLITALVIGILVLANVLAARSTQSLDLTRFRVNTLAPQSVLEAQSVSQSMDMIMFFRRSDPGFDDTKALLDRFASVNPKIRVSVQDPFVDPVQARQFGVITSGTVVIRYGGKTQLLNSGSQGEQDVASAVLKLESSRSPSVCWTVGEGERDLKDAAQITGYSDAAAQLAAENFTQRDLLLSQTGEIGSGCDIVVVMGPSKPLTDTGAKALTGYLDAGGSLLLALDPWTDPAVAARYNDLLKPYGLTFTDGLVVEDAAHSADRDPTTPAVVQYGASPIAKDLANRVSFFPLASAIAGSGAAGATVTRVASSSDQSYLVQDPRQDLARKPADQAGPFVLMETSERAPGGTAAKPSRVVLVGTASLGENRALEFSVVNRQLLVGSLDWLSAQENLIAIPAKPNRNPNLALTQEQQNLNVFVTLLLLPLLAGVGGLLVWARRRLF